MVWFKTSVGRKNKADPKWLLPLICRLGDVTKKDVGAIRITEHETRFQITEAASENFMTSLRDAGENEIRIEQADGSAGHRQLPSARGFRPRAAGARRGRPARLRAEQAALQARVCRAAGPRSIRSRALRELPVAAPGRCSPPQRVGARRGQPPGHPSSTILPTVRPLSNIACARFRFSALIAP